MAAPSRERITVTVCEECVMSVWDDEDRRLIMELVEHRRELLNTRIREQAAWDKRKRELNAQLAAITDKEIAKKFDRTVTQVKNLCNSVAGLSA